MPNRYSIHHHEEKGFKIQKTIHRECKKTAIGKANWYPVETQEGIFNSVVVEELGGNET